MSKKVLIKRFKDNNYKDFDMNTLKNAEDEFKNIIKHNVFHFEFFPSKSLYNNNFDSVYDFVIIKPENTCGTITGINDDYVEVLIDENLNNSSLLLELLEKDYENVYACLRYSQRTTIPDSLIEINKIIAFDIVYFESDNRKTNKNQDIFINTIKFALDNSIKQIEEEGIDSNTNGLIYETLKRDKAIIENLYINGLEYVGLNFDQFCEQCKEKRNILFLTDEELKVYNEAKNNKYKLCQILDIINKEK